MSGEVRRLLFVRHSLPIIQENIERQYWRLSEVGKQRADLVADHLARYSVQAVVSSNEMKAIETANAISSRIHRPFEVDERLREHCVDDEPFRSEPAFKRLVDNFFERPDDVVFGSESANAAKRRMAAAITGIRRKYRTGDVVIVSHGRILSMYLARYLDLDPFELWKQLKSPSVVALSLPNLEPVETVFAFAAPGEPDAG